jgi:putative membrane protein
MVEEGGATHAFWKASLLTYSGQVLSASLSLQLFADTWGMHDGDVGAGWMIVMMLGIVLFWGLVIVGVVWLLREAIGRGNNGHGAEPLAILDRRLAEGQISVEEYEQRRKTLGS